MPMLKTALAGRFSPGDSLKRCDLASAFTLIEVSLCPRAIARGLGLLDTGNEDVENRGQCGRCSAGSDSASGMTFTGMHRRTIARK